MKRYISLLLAFACLLGCGTVSAFADGEEGLQNFTRIHSYTDGLFADVSGEAWYRDNVAAAYELGLMKGMSDTSFGPEGNVTIAETLALAGRLHSIYHTGQALFEQGTGLWYRAYVEYALENGLISGEYEDYNAAATRREFAVILARSLPAEALPVINSIADDQLPDVKMGDPGADEIYSLYRAGILTGNNSRGKFAPDTSIQRSAVAAIVTRMAYRSLREKIELMTSPGPDLAKKSPAEDSFFEDAAILGNSLVDGLRLYSGLDTMTFYCGTSMTVSSAMKSKNVKLPDGSMGTQLDAMAQKEYGKVYIELGINEIGGDVNNFVKLYGAMLDRILADQPDVDVYVMAITPVSRSKSESSSVFNMKRVTLYNEALYALAEEKGCFYLDVCTPLLGADGYLPEADTWDGVHLTVAKYAEWESIIRSFYAN